MSLRSLLSTKMKYKMEDKDEEHNWNKKCEVQSFGSNGERT